MLILVDLIKNRAGATAIEYGMIVLLIALVLVGTLTIIGTQLSTKFTAIEAHL